MNAGESRRDSVVPIQDGVTAGIDPAEPGLPRARTAVESLARGSVIGRFIVHRTLGAGSTGVVYAAHDPELDRTIALKVLHRDLADRVDARARFLREAQALARLSHPNVIAVYDVGAADDHTFIAMEYIQGQTFASWVATSAPSWSEILAMLVKGGRGLAAAHAAGLIHRDFKPANLLVGLDGRVMVTDFGLARDVVEASVDGAPPVDQLPRSSAFAEPITRTGAIQGTPAYMAPEQQQGQPADARADQFSFCVTLYEAVFRAHPFLSRERSSSASAPGSAPSASTRPPASAQGAALASPAQAPGDARGVPAWLVRAVLRGLSTRPEDRYPDMDRLLAALTREPLRRRRRIRLGLAALGAALVGTGLTLGFAAMSARVEDSCTGAGEQLAVVWNPIVVDQVRAAFVATARPHAQSSADRVTARLEGYAREWATMHRATCLATARGEQSPDVLDRRMACLGRRLAQAGAVLDLFVRSADGELVDRALGMVAELEPLSACADSAALFARAAPQLDPLRRARVTELEHQVDRAELERHAGRPQAAADAARAVLTAERTLDHAPLAAQAGRVLGRSLDDLGRPAEAREALMRARREAERSGDTRMTAQLVIDLVYVVGAHEKRSAEAHLLGQLAEAALDHPELRTDHAMRAQLLEALGSVANVERQDARAVELLREALAIRRRVVPAMSEEVARPEEKLGVALSNMARHDEARAHYLEALAIRRRVFGEEHPLIADLRISLGTIDMEHTSNTAEARTHFLAALAILQQMPEYRTYPLVLHDLGLVETTAGNPLQARAYFEKALAVIARQLGPDHLDLATSQSGLGEVLYSTGDFAEALVWHRRAVALYEKNAATDHPWYALFVAAVGEDLRRLGRATESLGQQERALQLLRPRFGDHPMIGHVLAYQGMALVDLARRREAIAILERAVELLPQAEPTRARAAFALARALAPRGPTSERARVLAQEALATFTAVHATRERADVAAYLARSARWSTAMRILLAAILALCASGCIGADDAQRTSPIESVDRASDTTNDVAVIDVENHGARDTQPAPTASPGEAVTGCSRVEWCDHPDASIGTVCSGCDYICRNRFR